MAPEKLGPYVLVEQIGAGGMGNVYLGRHVETRQIAAVKVLPPSLAREEGFRLRFDREVEALQRLKNPHIVRLYESGVDGDSYYFAMEYVAGETLSSRLKRERRLLWQDAVDVTCQLCQALKAAHDAGVIHRDLKPSNILCGTDGTVKLTDFGVAQLFASEKLTITGGVVGTAEYMSPEQAQGQRATARSDLYALGAVLYVMIAGRPPFTGQTTVDILQKQRFGQFDRLSRYVPEIPPWLDDVVSQLLQKEPEKRFPDAYVLQRRLHEQLQRTQQHDAETTAVANRLEDGDPEISIQPAIGPGAGTMMRDLVRDEIRRDAEPTLWERTTDSPLVLIALLALLVVGVWWAMNRGLTDEQRYAAGIQLMEKSGGSEWQRARDEYFQPLVNENDAHWRERVLPWLQEIAVYEAEQLLSSRRRRQPTPQSEPERLLREVRQLWDQGQIVAASNRLKQVQLLLTGQPPWEALAQKWSEQLAESTANVVSPDSFLTAALERADALAKGNPPQARKIYQAIVDVYSEQPAAQAAVDRARQRLSAP